MTIIPILGFSEPFNSITHLLGAVVSFVAAYFLIYRGRGNSNRVIGLLIYSFCLIFLLSMSGVYHLLEKGGEANYVLHVLDYTGIFGLISGTFTPIHIILFRGLHRWLVLVIVWTLSITGLTLTAVFFSQIPQGFNLSVFLFLGWIGLYTLWKIYHMHSKRLVKLMLYGGVSYTVGAIIEFAQWPDIIPGVIDPHGIFHIFVLLGAYFHWRLVYEISKYPISSKITIIVRELPEGVFQAVATSEKVSFTGGSVKEIKETVLKWIENEYHHSMRPTFINFKYTQEEDLCLKPK